MKFDEKSQKISEKSQRRIDRIGIILGLSLIIACGFSYFVLDAFGQQDFEIDCPENSYHGLDSYGNEVCRNILTNQIIEPELRMIIDSNSEKMSIGVHTTTKNFITQQEKLCNYVN